jgi:nucleoside-diphosphate-sugar epimerase
LKTKVLVTGAAGFIGSHLCEKLVAENFEVTGIDNFDPFYPKHFKQNNLAGLVNKPHFNFIEGDLCDKSVLERISFLPDVVIHLAAKAGVQPSLANATGYIKANIACTNTILEWMKAKQIKKLVFASSSSVYGNTREMPFVESQNTDNPISPYAFTKRSCELMNYTYHQLYEIDILNLRFFTVYGERQRPDLAIHKFVRKIFLNEPIHIFGKGDTARDYTYWSDTVAGVSAAINYVLHNSSVFEAINIGNNEPIPLITLVNEIAEVMNKEPQIVYEDKKAGDVDVTFANITKAVNLLNYHPDVRLKEGLTRFIDWYKLNQVLLNKT